MYYAGIDYHKRYSVVCVHDAQGRLVQEQRVDHAFPEVFQRLFKEYPEPEDEKGTFCFFGVGEIFADFLVFAQHTGLGKRL